jgi:alpha-L-fucosidase 2
LLPALPAGWQTGKITGIKARGGFTVDLEWDKGRLTRAHISSKKESSCLVNYSGLIKELTFRPNQKKLVLF